ncbi:MAG: putative LPS assembly protein LptD [Cytophagales bacterium]|nr:putative LPS assembly protein LptD [Bernardetiaceae bacterium]MDW8206079.1 putative LPS assembly protein LptD [Cytophagales bacterium]
MKKLAKVTFSAYFACLGLWVSLSAVAQNQRRENINSLAVATDSLAAQSDSLVNRVPKGDITTTINYQAKDSIRFDVRKRMIYMYGDAKIVYGDISLKAAQVAIDWTQNTIKATYVRDTATNREIGLPEFTEGGETYTSKQLAYNFKTRKAKVTGVTTKYGEGFILLENVKKDENDNSYGENGLYTTCDAPIPHFGIRARKMKVIPGKVIVSGLFNLEINRIPTPLGFAFGMFPQPKSRSSGFVMPQYGETRERGFFLSQGGFYFVLSDNFDLSLLGEVHTKGGWGLTAATRYKKRYAFDGQFRFQYNRRINEVPGQVENNVVNDFNISWNHTPQSKGDSRFSASVNAGTNTFGRNNAPQLNNFQSSSFNSNISYNKTFTGTPFTAGVNLRHEQNIITRIVSIFPEANIGMNRIYPFKGKKSDGKSIFSQFNFSYTGRARAVISNNRQGQSFPFKVAGNLNEKGEPVNQVPASFLPFNFENLNTIFGRAQMGVQHNIPVTTAVTLFKYFTTSFNGNYSEVWYPERYIYTLERNDIVRIDTIRGFSRFYSYNIGASVQTRLYGFFYPKSKKIDRIRLTINPNAGFNYQPDFGDPRFNFFDNLTIQPENQTSANLVRQSRLNGIYGQPISGRQGSISFGLTNTLEMKMRPKEDTASASAASARGAAKAPQGEKITILDNIGINTSYNMAADSFKLAPIALSARTNLLKKFNVAFNATLDPYGYELLRVDTTGRRLAVVQRRNRSYAWQNGNGLGNLTNASIAISANFAPPQANRKLRSNKATQEELDFISRNRNLYVDFTVPWTLSVSYNLSYNKTGFEQARVTQTLNFNGDLKMTEKWKIGFNSGYDFEAKGLSFTQFTIYRDLHCWVMNVSWIPFGPRAGYTLDINVRASVLSDLKLSRRNLWYFR